MTQADQVFISYSRKDGIEYAEWLESELTKAGFKPWRDKHGLLDGEIFPPQLETAIKESFCVLACITPTVNSNSESWVHNEIHYARKIAKKTVIPLIFPGAEATIEVVALDWIKFESGTGSQDELEKILQKLNRIRDTIRPKNESRDDPYRPYLLKLIDTADKFLSKTVYSMIEVQAQSAPDEVIEGASDYDILSAVIDYFEQTTPDLDSLDDVSSEIYANFEDAFRHHNGRLLLLGDPGMGKTVTLMAFAREMARRRLEDKTRPLPLFTPVASWQPDWNPDRGKEDLPKLSEWLALNFPVMKEDLARLIDSGNVLLLLDAVDELGRSRNVSHRTKSGLESAKDSAKGQSSDSNAAAGSQSHEAVPDPDSKIQKTYDPRELLLECLKQQIPDQTQIVVSCRITDYHELQGRLALNGAVYLRELTNDQIQHYLRKMPELWDVLKNNDELLKVVKSPLMLNLFRDGYQGLDEQTRALKDLTKGELRDAIFEKVYEKRYEREDKKLSLQGRSLPFSQEALRGIFEKLALANLLDADEEGIVAIEDLEQVLEESQLTDFITVAEVLHLLTPQDESGERYRFLHLMLRDFFAYSAARRELAAADIDRRNRAVEALIKLSPTDVRAVKDLIDNLSNFARDDHADMRRRIADAIAASELPEGVQVFVDLLSSDRDASVRQSAANGLGRLGAGLESLIEALDDEAPQVRLIAVQSLGRIGDPRAVEPLARKLNDNETARARRYWYEEVVGDKAADALVRLGVDASFKVFVDALRSDEPSVRYRAAAALGELEDASAVVPLIEAITDDDPDVIEAVCKSLGGLKDSRAVLALIGVLANPSGHVRQAAAVALGKIGDLRAVDPLISLLVDSDEEVRESAHDALVELGDAAAPHILELLVGGATDDDLTAAYIEILGDLEYQPGVDTLIGMLGHPNPTVRKSTAAALGDVGDTRAAAPLLAIFKDAQTADDLKFTIASALGDLKDPSAIQPLVAAFSDSRANDNDAEISDDVGRALKGFGDQVVEPLRDALNSPDPQVRLRISRLLSDLDTGRVVPIFIHLLDDADKDLRLDAIRTLGGREASSAVVPLVRLLQNDAEESEIRCAAIKALRKIEARGVLSPIFTALSDKDDDVALEALSALIAMGHIDDWRCEAPLEAMLRSKTVKVRVEAAKALAKRGELRFVDDMIHLLRDYEIKDDTQRGSLFDAIEVMVKEKLPKKSGLDYFCRALSSLIEEKYDLSRTFLTKAIEIEPEGWYHWYWRAEITCNWLDTDCDQALRDCEQAIRLGADREYVFRQAGDACLKIRDWDQAIAYFEKAMALEPNNGSAHFGMGRAFDKKAEYAQAAAAFEKAVELDPDQASYYNWLGYARNDLRQYELAIETFDQAIARRDEDYGSDYSGRGWSKYYLGDYLGAFEDFRTAENHRGMGDIYQVARDYQKALAEYDENIKRKPDEDVAYQIRGLNYLILDQSDKAAADFAQAVELDPENTYHVFWGALNHINRSDWDAALANLDLEQSLPTRQTDLISRAYNVFWRAVIAEKRASADEARTLYQESLALALPAPNERGSQSRVVGLIELMMGEREAARTHYEEAIRQQPLRSRHFSPPLYLLVLSRIFPERTDIRETLEWYEQRLGPIPVLPADETPSEDEPMLTDDETDK